MWDPVSIIFALVFFVIAQRVLDRMHLTDVQSIIVIAIIIAGTFFNVTLAQITVNLGGLAAISMAVYVFLKADRPAEQLRTITAAGITAAIVYIYPAIASIGEPGLDLLYWQGPIVGIIAYILGRSRRAAFSGGVFAVLILDVAHLITARRMGMPGTVIGGAGAFDALVLAGITGAVVSEVIGEIRERLVRGSGGGGR